MLFFFLFLMKVSPILYLKVVGAYLANMLIVETVPLAVTERFDAGVVVATCSTPRMDHDWEQLKGQQALRVNTVTFF